MKSPSNEGDLMDFKDPEDPTYPLVRPRLTDEEVMLLGEYVLGRPEAPPDYRDTTVHERTLWEAVRSDRILIENLMRALDVALSGRVPHGKLPRGLNREEMRFFCLGIITEEDFKKGTPHLGSYTGHGTMMTNMYLTDDGRRKIEAAKAELGEWPDPTSE